jgi:hypothetical protein
VDIKHVIIINYKMDVTALQAHVEKAFDDAENGISKINQEIIDMEGMSGIKTRHFYNNLLNRPDARYLEIGTWKGSSVCAAMCGNNAHVVAIDNWSQFGGPKSEFIQNFKKFKGDNYAIFIEKDCYQVDVESLPNFNTYMYDGEHSKENHGRALTHFYNCLDNTFIFIVDDWNWLHVREGTLESFDKLNLKVLYNREIRTTFDNKDVIFGSDAQRAWHNGIFVAILQKQ